MPAGIGASGAFGLALETTQGTWVTPSVWVPILEESVAFTTENYYSEAIQQQTMDSDMKKGPYHVEGDVTMEADTAMLPYFMHCARVRAVTKTGVGPYVYKYQPGTQASNPPKTMSITILKNGSYFKYAGCQVGQHEWTIEDGVLRVTFSMLGLKEETVDATSPVPAWPASRSLFGMDAHQIYVGTAGSKPAGGSEANNFNGFTFTVNDNAEAQNRINPNRQANYVLMGKTELEVSTELDFIDRTEYTNFVNQTLKSVRLKSTNAAPDYVDITAYRMVYDTYEIPTPGMGDLVSASVTFHGLGLPAAPYGYDIEIGSTANIT